MQMKRFLPFTFTLPVLSGATYSVTVKTQPSGPIQSCQVTGGGGIVGTGPVSSVAINCTTLYTVGGTVGGGLVGSGLILRNNGSEEIPISGPGMFAFPTPVTSGTPYAVTVLSQPTSDPLRKPCERNGIGRDHHAGAIERFEPATR